MTTPNVSPFTFLTWKDDEGALIAGTPNTDLGYIQLLSIDGINIDDIVEYAVSQHGETALTHELAAKFPSYVAAVAAARGSPCFTSTNKADVEYADVNTGEVADATFDATESNYNECVRIEQARAEYDGARKEKAAAAGRDGDDDDDDDYEDVDDEEGEEGYPASSAYMAKRRLMDMVSTQFETAMSIAFDMELTIEEIKDAYKAAMPESDPLPQTAEECMAAAEGNPPLKEYLASVFSKYQGEEDEAHGGVPVGMPEGAQANCPQQ